MGLTDREQLERWRQIGARQSEKVVVLAPKVLRSGKLGDDEWAVREQLAFAALDVGQIELASEQIVSLSKRFPGSPRVEILVGQRLEASGDVQGAKQVYKDLLAKDETNVAAHQRMIALSRASGPTTSIPLLLKYLDTFYTDAAGWSLLADLYAEQGMYGQSLTALGHVMVINGWDSGAVAKAGEVAYTMGDYQLALKYFLRAVEMETPPAGTTLRVEGKRKTRSWLGIRKSTEKLIESPLAETSISPNLVVSEEKVQALNELAREQLLGVGEAGEDARRLDSDVDSALR